jgi:hypothetical protein
MSRRLLTLLLVTSLLVVVPPLGDRGAEAAPATNRVIEVAEHLPEQAAVRAGEARTAAGARSAPEWITSETIPGGDAALVGVRAPAGVEVPAMLRTLEDGTWSEWLAFEYLDEDDGPDPGTAEAADAAEPVSEPVWIGRVEQLQLRVAAVDGLDSLELHTVDFEGSLDFDPLAPKAGSANAVERPNFIPRSSWDPNNECAPRSSPSVASSARFAVVHHTAGSNS